MNISEEFPSSAEMFENFRRVASIPRGSGNTGAIADFCIAVAQKHNCKSYRDNAGNVIVYVDGTKGYENSHSVILQGHLDMVCDKTEDCKIDMTVQGVELCDDGEYIFANGTTLGSDDGIAVAYMLTLIEDKSIPHPPLELLFTADEEIGLIGASALNASQLKSNRLINIDSEMEGVLTVSCAGAVRAACKIPIVTENASGACFKICISGLRGGHSGTEINAGRVSALRLMSRMLNYISQETEFKISHIRGGKKFNAIPSEAEAVVCTNAENKEKFIETAQKFISAIMLEKAVNEPGLEISVNNAPCAKRCMDEHSTRKALFTLLQIPNGVQTMSPDIPNMVQTSLNMGIFETEESCMSLYFLVRSNAAAGKQTIVQKLKSFIEYMDGTIDFMSDYPAWEYKPDSKLRDIMAESYVEMYGEQPVITSIHAGLECGILAGKIDNLDAVSFGPNILHAHTPKEKMEIASAVRCWEFLKTVLKNLK